MLTQHSTIEATRAAFAWDIPTRYNIGVDCCDRIAATRPEAVAIIDVDKDGAATSWTFGQLRDLSNQLAQALSGHISREDRIGVLLPQQIETAAAHIAVAKAGGIAIPLFTLFGPDALLHRLSDAGARVVVTNKDGAAQLATLRDQLPDLILVVSTNGGGDISFADFIAPHDTTFTPVDTGPDDPAILIYTSGTTGPPKGALHAHRVLLGHLPGVEMSHDFFPQEDDLIWTPADWAWIGGLLDVLLPALHHGVPVVACRFRKFTGEAAFDLIRRLHVRNAFLPPTALKIMRQVPNPPATPMRTIASGGETLGASLLDWGRDVFGVTINEFYGQTECNMIVSSCGVLEAAAPGIMGWPVPGHRVAVLTSDGEPAPCDAEGNIAVAAPDPVMFLRYWNKPEATEAKFVAVGGERWLLTGDRGVMLPSGRIRFVGRDDDVISSAGYRIGPAEIEDCLITHPAVQMAGVVGQKDALRGEIVVAFVVLQDRVSETTQLLDQLADHVRQRLAAYEVPRRIISVPALPMTTTGKIIRAALRAKLA